MYSKPVNGTDCITKKQTETQTTKFASTAKDKAGFSQFFFDIEKLLKQHRL